MEPRAHDDAVGRNVLARLQNGSGGVVQISSVMSVTPISNIWSLERKNSVSDTTLRTGKPSAWRQLTIALPAARSAETHPRGGVAECPIISAGSSCPVNMTVSGWW